MSSWKGFKIEKGHHVSEPMRLALHAGGFPHRESKSVIFGRGCNYDLGGVDQLDINKLWGLSQWNHLRNSFRFGWRWNAEKSKVEVLPFTTIKGEDNRLSSVPLYSADLESSIQTTMTIERRQCHFECNGNSITIGYSGAPLSSIRFGYFLRPYFGGNRVAPHNMEIYLK